MEAPIKAELVEAVLRKFSTDYCHAFSDYALESLTTYMTDAINRRLTTCRNLSDVVVLLRSKEMHDAADLVEGMR